MPDNLQVRLVRLIVSKILRFLGPGRHPIADADLERLAAVQGMNIDDSPALGNLDGCISGTGSGPTIRVNPRLSREERRMTIAHEIGHTIIDRDLPVQSGRLRFKTNAFHFVQPHVREQLCDLIASELLLPTPLFFAAVETAPGSSDVVSDIAKEFGIPETTIMMRMNCHSGMSSRWRLC